jgi:hypothetical protein
MNRPITRAAIVTALTLSAGAATAEVGWSVDAGASHTDNAARVATGKADDTLATLGGTLSYGHESRRIEAALSASGTYMNYLDGSYQDDFVSQARGSLVLGIVPERFLWTVDDTYGQITVNEFQSVTPTNRQNANYFSTGPDLILRLGSATSVKIGGRFADSRYERTDTVNDQRLSGSVTLSRNTSPNVTWSVVADAARVEYDLPGNPGYDQQSLYGLLQAQGARQSLEFGLGGNQVADNGETYSNPLLRLTWTRKLTPSWSLAVNAGSEYRNTGDQFRSAVAAGGTGTEAIRVTGIPSEAYFGGVSLSFERPRTTFGVGANFSRDNYVRSSEPDKNSWSTSAGVSRRFTRRLRGFLDASYQKRDFQSGIGEDKTTLLSAKLDWALGRSTFVTAGYRHEDRSSNIGANGYTENVISLSVSYRYGKDTGPRSFAY